MTHQSIKNYLIIDSSTERGMIAYGNSKELLFERALPFGLNQSKYLLPTLMEALKPYGAVPEVAAVGVGMGPGSYTGIRVGVAIAQTLAYCWKVPLIGVSSLAGFIPSAPTSRFATVVDARIGGLYFQKGKCLKDEVIFEGEPQVCPLEEARLHLEEVTHLVAPHVKGLQEKLTRLHPDVAWIWEEQSPSGKVLLQQVERKHLTGKVVEPPEHLDLLYLRKTQAENEKTGRNLSVEDKSLFR